MRDHPMHLGCDLACEAHRAHAAFGEIPVVHFTPFQTFSPIGPLQVFAVIGSSRDGKASQPRPRQDASGMRRAQANAQA